MASTQIFDVVIVGGGMAGLAAAETLVAAPGRSVALIEKRQVGANRTVRAVFQDAVEAFDLQSTVLRAYDGHVFSSPLGARARFPYGFTALSAVDYTQACALMLERARRAGLETIQASALRFSPNPPEAGQPFTITLSNGAYVRTQVLIDASGPLQWSARQLGIRRSKHASVCYGERLLLPAADADSCFHFLAPSPRFGNGGGWYYPLDDGTASFGYSRMVKNDDLRQNQRTAAGYHLARAAYQPYAGMLAEAQGLHVEGGLIPVGRIGRFFDHRLLIAGDAAGHASSWTVGGCQPALENGRKAAEVALSALKRGQFDRAAFAPFERDWARENAERFWRTESVADVVWQRSEEEIDRVIALYQKMPPARQFYQLKENRVSWPEQVYARGGYARRQFSAWLKARLKSEKAGSA